MRKFKFDKLVRDKIVDTIKRSGDRPVFRKLSKNEYVKQLVRKLLEEVEELPSTKRRDLIKEIADVQEIIDNLLNVSGITETQLKEEQTLKNRKAGSFKKKLYIDYVEVEDDSEWIEYFESQPDKFPEIKNSY